MFTWLYLLILFIGMCQYMSLRDTAFLLLSNLLTFIIGWLAVPAPNLDQDPKTPAAILDEDPNAPSASLEEDPKAPATRLDQNPQAAAPNPDQNSQASEPSPVQAIQAPTLAPNEHVQAHQPVSDFFYNQPRRAIPIPQQNSSLKMIGTRNLFRLERLINSPAPDQYTQEAHAWNPDDHSLNISVKDDDKFTFHRRPIPQSTDGIRGKIGYSRGFHMWQIEWPKQQRGTYAGVGVATATAPLHTHGYRSLIGMSNESYGWDITRRECHHNSKHTERECHHNSKHTKKWQYPPKRDSYIVPDKFYCILDMDEGYMAFATDDEYLGVAFDNLKGKNLYPVVAAVWGHCEVGMRFLGSLDPEPLSLAEICRSCICAELGMNPRDRINYLPLPFILKQFLSYQ